MGGGRVRGGGSTISAGDLNSDGKLILGLNNGSVVVVPDLERCMDQKSWGVLDPFLTGLGDIKWLAPLPQQPNQVLVRTQNKIVLLDIENRTQVASMDIAGQVLKASKFTDPHIVLQEGHKVRVVYVQNSQIKERVYIPKTDSFEMYSLLSSTLDLAQDTWSFVDSKEGVYFNFNDPNGVVKNRRFARYRFSDQLATQSTKVENEAQIEMAPGFIFSLHPSELGYAVRYDVETDVRSELKLFNLKYIPAD